MPRERGLLAERDAFGASGEREAWLAARGLASLPGERRVSVFCYPSAPLAALLETIAAGPSATRVFVPAGVGDAAIGAFFGAPIAAGHERARGALTVRRFALLAPDDYDRLLWSCATNFVRGEDSWVRAQWAGAPFVWQPYPQAGGAHLTKLDALLARLAEQAGGHPPALRAAASLMRAWSGDGDLAAAWGAHERAADALRVLHRRWCEHLAAQPDLATQLAEYCRNRL